MLNIIHQIIGNHPGMTLPSALSEREFNVANLLIPVIIVSFSLITLAKYRNNRVLIILLKLFISSKNLEHTLKEEMRIDSVSSISLMINYVLVLSTCFFLTYFHFFKFGFYLSLGYSLMSSVGFSILQTMGLWLVGILSSETKTTNIPIIETVMLYESFGLLLFFLSLIWLLNPQYSEICVQIFELVLALEILVRFFKCVISVLKRGISWYYIILYLCTLEILPLFALYMYVQKNFAINIGVLI